MEKLRAFLQVAIADQLKVFALGKDRFFIVDRAILKAKDQMRYDLVSACRLDGIAGSEGFASRVAQQEKSTASTQAVPHRNLLTRERSDRAEK
jgi:hypothetical protein